MDAAIEADKSLWNTMNKILFPVFVQAATAVGGVETQRNLTLTTIELFEIRLRSGAFPASLPNQASSMDPFSSKPLK